MHPIIKQHICILTCVLLDLYESKRILLSTWKLIGLLTLLDSADNTLYAHKTLLLITVLWPKK